MNINPFTIVWLILGCVALWYITKGILRSYHIARFLQTEPNRELEHIIAVRRLEREENVLIVELILTGAGVVSVFVPRPVVTEVQTFVSWVLPIAFILAHVFLVRLSYMTHAHHHEMMNKVSAMMLKRELATRLKAEKLVPTPIITEVAVAEIKSRKFAIALVDEHEETKHES
jgi:hypothetical protein